MGALIWGSGLWLLGFLMHVVVWRVRVPRRQTRALLAIFLAVLAAGTAVGAIAGAKLRGLVPVPAGVAEWSAAALLTVSLALAYVISHSALEAESPTLAIIRMIVRAGASGLPRQRLHDGMDDQVLVIPRLDDLVRDGMVELRGDTYRLLPKGRRFVTVFLVFRRLLGIGRGG